MTECINWLVLGEYTGGAQTELHEALGSVIFDQAVQSSVAVAVVALCLRAARDRVARLHPLDDFVAVAGCACAREGHIGSEGHGGNCPSDSSLHRSTRDSGNDSSHRAMNSQAKESDILRLSGYTDRSVRQQPSDFEH
jgi:hypothetical protein